MEALRVVICDTNPMELERYMAVCQAVCAKNRVVAVFSVFSSSRALLFEMMDPACASMVNILVLEPFNGCEVVAEAVRKAGYNGIILYHSWVTDKQYFYQAFDANAYNYIEKGGPARFEAVFESALKAAQELRRQCIALSCAGDYRQIDLQDIYFFETGMSHMICVWYADGKFVFFSSLSKLEVRLKECGFIRIHRSYLVALDAVHRLSFEQVTLVNGKVLPVSRRNYAALKSAMDKRSRQ